MIDGICGYVVSSVINGNFGNRVCDMIDNVCGNVCGMMYVYDVGENDVCGKINGKCCSSQTLLLWLFVPLQLSHVADMSSDVM